MAPQGLRHPWQPHRCGMRPRGGWARHLEDEAEQRARGVAQWSEEPPCWDGAVGAAGTEGGVVAGRAGGRWRLHPRAPREGHVAQTAGPKHWRAVKLVW